MSVFVVGMHRSGTSLLTALLAMTGLNPGPVDALTGPNEYNPKGFWELNRFRAVNEKLLRHQNCEWDCPLHFKPDQMGVSQREIAGEAREVLDALYDSRGFVVKDPRLCLTFRFWRGFCPDVVPVVPIRAPLEVAASLYRRNSIPIPIGIALWEYYILSSARETKDADPLVISHHALVARPENTLRWLTAQIASRSAIALEMPKKSMIANFVDTSLHHHVFSTEEQRRFLVPDQLDFWDAAQRNSLGCLSSRELSPASRAALEGYEALGMQFSRVRQLENAQKS